MIRYPRIFNKWYAELFGFFWLPCPICKEHSGGHEWLSGHSISATDNGGEGVCYKKSCALEAKYLTDLRLTSGELHKKLKEYNCTEKRKEIVEKWEATSL